MPMQSTAAVYARREILKAFPPGIHGLCRDRCLILLQVIQAPLPAWIHGSWEAYLARIGINNLGAARWLSVR